MDSEVADQLQDIDLAIDVAFEKFDMGRIGRKLVEDRVQGDPFAKPNFGPSVIVKSTPQVDHPNDGLGRDSNRSGESVEEYGMLVAVSLPSLKHLQGIGDTDRWLFCNLSSHPPFNQQYGSAAVLFLPDNFSGE